MRHRRWQALEASNGHSEHFLAGCDLVIEAVAENLAVKTEVFQKLEKLVNREAILASNTSSLSIASVAAACDHPERVLGIHFFNPAPLMKLVEVVPAVQTDSHYTELVVQSIQDWGKIVALAKDTPVQIPFLLGR